VCSHLGAHAAQRQAAGLLFQHAVLHVSPFTLSGFRDAMPHVLIVDDDAGTREALSAIIGEDGLTTATAGDLREARIQLVRQMPDVVFTDLKLPDGSGVDLFEDLDPRSGVEVIVITGHATVESAVNALKMGATDYLVKPINMQRVKAILSRLPRAAC
jgi:DNA-binding NtrC family response regulator